jgi:hypothetical protein
LKVKHFSREVPGKTWKNNISGDFFFAFEPKMVSPKAEPWGLGAPRISRTGSRLIRESCSWNIWNDIERNNKWSLNCGLCEVYVVSTIYCIICPNPESK